MATLDLSAASYVVSKAEWHMYTCTETFALIHW